MTCVCSSIAPGAICMDCGRPIEQPAPAPQPRFGGDELTEMIARGWGDTPQSDIPDNWRKRLGPDFRRWF